MEPQEEYIKELWQKYKEDNDRDSRTELIKIYAPYVKYLARRLYEKLPANVELDDLMSYGTMGLMDAINKFDPAKKVKFKTYAGTRIHGAIIDELRNTNWVPRSVVQKTKELDKTITRLNNQLSREATPEEIAEEMGISMDDLNKIYREARRTVVLSIDEIYYDDENSSTRGDFIENKNSPNPLDIAQKTEMKKLLVEAIDSLGDREKLVVSLYYFEELTLKEIGKVLGVSDSRVSQLHTKAVERLRGRLKKVKEDFVVD
ncbi:MAG: RNA polymerase sigma factor WhiG [Candidatus Muiribacterium halophilum]|uniref:RNA polymerase sigma factor n=1 Tax=Muiribacterium halophilum TaxID=2053465 RepID=A0A2N5ZJE1_MUIH1|nr:MAG: RNA polymerase sigma factor WhiG [Candidatus Muirbacterium halophilum]